MNNHLFTIRKTGEEPRVVKLHCKHQDAWPPTSSMLGSSPEHLRQKKVISEHAYEAHKVWLKQCGKSKMDDGCATCDLSRARARITARGTGRIKFQEIEFAAFMKTSRTDVQLVYEKEAPKDASPTPTGSDE